VNSPGAPASATPPSLHAEALLKHLEWTVLRRLDGLLHGNYRTLMRGFGLDLADLREYQPQDDVRTIDWNVTARMQTPYVREFQEDREVTIWLLMDLSRSVDFGSGGTSKRALALSAMGVLSRLFTRHGNRVGALLFDGQTGSVPQVIKPGTSRLHVLRLMHRLVAPGFGTQAEAAGAPRKPPGWAARVKERWFGRRAAGDVPPDAAAGLTALGAMLAFAQRQLRRRSVLLVVSDFISEPGWTAPLGALAQRHDVVAVHLMDPAESSLPDLGMVTLQDAETGEQLFVDTSDPVLRRRFAEQAAAREATLAQGLAVAGVDRLTLSTGEPLEAALVRFAHRRKLRARQLAQQPATEAPARGDSHAA
jgi:uncharacterized protein (DUF58 family)